MYTYAANNPINAIDPLGTTIVYSPNPFTGQSPNEYGPYTKYYDDGYGRRLKPLQQLCEKNVRTEEINVFLRLQEKSKFDMLDPSDEASFDTQYYVPKGGGGFNYYQFNDNVISSNDLNYIGIGMYEAWTGDPEAMGEALIKSWKMLRYRAKPSKNALDSFHRGYKTYKALEGVNINKSKFSPSSASGRR